MSGADISSAYRQWKLNNVQSADSDEEPGVEWMKTQKNNNDSDAEDDADSDADSDTGDDASIDTEYDIQNMSPQMLLSLAPYMGIWDKLSEEQIQPIVDTKSGLTLNGEAVMSSYKGRNSYRTPRKPKFVLLSSGERFYI